MDNLTRPHIILPDDPQSLSFTSRQTGGPKTEFPQRDRLNHGQWLQNRFEEIWRSSTSRAESRRAASVPSRKGVYIEFSSQPDFPLKTQSLEQTNSGIRLLNIRQKEFQGHHTNLATVYIPNGKAAHFLKKFREYTSNTTSSGNPKNNDLAASIEEMQTAMLESFWVDDPELIPDERPCWCEVWLLSGSPESDNELLNNFFQVCQRIGINYKNQKLSFPERLITLIHANRDQLSELIESFDYIAEFRRAQEPESFWTSLPNIEQANWVEDLKNRLQINNESEVLVSVLDSGINNGHPLLNPVLWDENCHSADPDWPTNDMDGHGTLMAGICTYGNLKEALESNDPVELISNLESIKILPHTHENDQELYGFITAQGISNAEISTPDARRIFCMAVTSKYQTDMGRPSSWSAEIDALAAGTDDNIQRLFIISAGNIKENYLDYPEINSLSSIESPAQSWNALTVGAITNKSSVDDTDFDGYHLLATPGSLSPYSTTSFSWESKLWPNKPDIVFEGGNLLLGPENKIEAHEDLEELSTYHRIITRYFQTLNGTSLATAKAAYMASVIRFYYPEFWPETIRGLMVHSADWTQELINQFNIDLKKKEHVARLLRHVGYGTPNLQKALHCAANSLTLIVENELQPYKKEGTIYKTNEMHLYNLPWPKDQLMDLGDVQVKLRITLSFFIEPGPGEVGWKDRYRYASHGLRFDLNNVDETEQDFIARLNKEADNDGENLPGGSSGSERWLIGSNNRKLGSIHSDIWEGNAADLAACNLIGIFPIIGWWRERHHLKCYNKITRYALIVSLEVPEQDVDIYTTVKNMVSVPVEIKV
ncbi:MAG: S8 family peptidase [Bacteroidota bacterium]